MFKAADGRNRWVKEGGLGLEAILHLEEFSSWPEWLTMESRSSSSRPMVLEIQWFCFSTVQTEGWLGPEIQSAKRDSSKLNMSLTWWWSLLRDESGHQEADKDPEHTHHNERGTTRPLFTMVTTRGANPCPTASFLSHLADYLDREREKKVFWLVWAFLPPLLWLCVVGSESFSLHKSWTSCAEQSKARDAKFYLQAGRPFQVSLLRMWYRCIQRLFGPELLWWTTTWEDWQSSH